jgi:hypothetical protein
VGKPTISKWKQKLKMGLASTSIYIQEGGALAEGMGEQTPRVRKSTKADERFKP